jgi:hypothetical protein
VIIAIHFVPLQHYTQGQTSQGSNPEGKPPK